MHTIECHDPHDPKRDRTELYKGNKIERKEQCQHTTNPAFDNAYGKARIPAPILPLIKCINVSVFLIERKRI